MTQFNLCTCFLISYALLKWKWLVFKCPLRNRLVNFYKSVPLTPARSCVSLYNTFSSSCWRIQKPCTLRLLTQTFSVQLLSYPRCLSRVEAVKQDMKTINNLLVFTLAHFNTCTLAHLHNTCSAGGST